MKRRIIYKLNKATKQTDVLCMQVAEELEDIELKMLDMDYQTDKDKFDIAKKISIKDGKIVFDELYPIDKNVIKTKELAKKNTVLEEQKEKLENQLLLQTNANVNIGGIL